MRDILPSVSEIDEQIAAARENIRELIEQAAAYSGAAAEELVAQRVNDQEALLQFLIKRRVELSTKEQARQYKGEMK
jgi:hypothetical protein